MKDQENLRRLRREWYHRNKQQESEKQRIRKKKRYEEAKIFLDGLKESTPCADCGNTYPSCVMDFDHLDDKKFSIANRKGDVSLKTLLFEISKCEIVCANCHRLRTLKRMVIV